MSIFFFTANESNNILRKELFPASDLTPLAACPDVFRWVKEAVTLCKTQLEDTEQKECILAVILLVIQAAREDRITLNFDSCRAIHPTCMEFLSELKDSPLPKIKGIADDLSDRLVPRIALAQLMKQSPDSRLSQLSKCEFQLLTCIKVKRRLVSLLLLHLVCILQSGFL